jgi:hypothetical protein
MATSSVSLTKASLEIKCQETWGWAQERGPCDDILGFQPKIDSPILLSDALSTDDTQGHAASLETRMVLRTVSSSILGDQ